jgi:hypothetical protein
MIAAVSRMEAVVSKARSLNCRAEILCSGRVVAASPPHSAERLRLSARPKTL